MIENSKIEEIREKADIIEIISGYTALRKKGKNYLALCPFHSEKTPSFTVSQEKQLFHCFGCGEGGNVFTFLMKIENVGFMESVKLLADKVGVEFSPEDSSGKRIVRDDNRVLYAILNEAAKFFQANLEKDPVAKKYADDRGLSQKILNFFRIGSSIDSWDSLYKHLMNLSFSQQDIEKAGMIIRKDDGTSHYDRFRKRLMFPIWDQTGRVIAFGARSLDGSNPKYINSPDSPVYNKGSVLYGLNFSKDEIKTKNQVCIIEGYMDFIRCYAHGIKNIVASSGTSLTSAQIKLLQRYTNNFVLVFDSDAAGAAASERSIEVLGEMGIFPKVVSLEGGKDPDEILRKEGVEKMRALIDTASPSMKYKLEAVIKRHNIKEAEGKAKAAREAAVVLSKEKNLIIKDEYIKFVSNRLGISSENFLSEMKRASYYKGHSKQNRSSVNKPDSKILKAESTLLRLWMEAPEMRARVTQEVKEDDFCDPSSKKVFTFFVSLGVSDEERTYGKVIDMIEDQDGKKLLSQIALDKHDIMDINSTLKDCITVLKSNAIRSKISGIRHLMKEAEEAKDLERLNSLQSEYLKYHGQILAL